MPRPTPDQVKALVSYDPDTGCITWKQRDRSWFKREQDWITWNKRFSGKPAFNLKGKNGYYSGSILNYSTYAHRIAHVVVTGGWPSHYVDHINRDKLDNRWHNLRPVTSQENQRNSKKSKNNTSGHTGVYWNKMAKKWQAFVHVDHKPIYLGLFTDIEKAVQARLAAQRQHGFAENHGV